MMNLLVKYSLLSFPVASFGLGVWQLKRLEWKKGLVAMLEERCKAEPIDLLQITSVEDLNRMEYSRLKARGHFDQDPSHQLFLKPRQLIMSHEARIRGRTDMQSNVGVNIVTPFQLDETDLRILVNRGWLASKGNKDDVMSNAHLGMGKEGDSIELTGVLRTSDRKETFGLKNDERSNEWQIRDVEAMARVLKTAPIFIDVDETLTHGSGPIGGQTQLTVRNEHLNYAITWFSLAVISFLMWYSKYGKHRRFFLKLHK